jgi:hypothetical protein
MSLMELEELPAVEGMSPRLGGLTSRQLATLAIIAGEAGYNAPTPPDPDRVKWALRVLRKLAWEQAQKRHKRHFPWRAWNSFHHPV